MVKIFINDLPEKVRKIESFQWFTILYSGGAAFILSNIANMTYIAEQIQTNVPWYYSIIFMVSFLIAMLILSIWIINESKVLSVKTDWPLFGSVMTWLFFSIAGLVYMLLIWYRENIFDLSLWLWWALFGIVPALIQGIYAIRRNINSRYFMRLHFVKQQVKLQYLKQLQDKWSSELTWFMTIFVALGITGVLTIIGSAKDDVKMQYLFQWLGAFGYGFVGILFGVFGQIITIINRIIDKTVPP